MERKTIPGAGAGIVLWGKDPIQSVVDRFEFLMRCRPQIVVLHGTPAILLKEGPAASVLAKTFSCGGDLWWEIAGGLLSEVDLWPQVAEAAYYAGAKALVINAEKYWLHKYKAPGEATKEMAKLAPWRPEMAIGFTSFGWPVHVPGFGGGHGDFPWAEFCTGKHGADFAIPQVYWRSDKKPGNFEDVAPRGIGLKSETASRESHQRGIAEGLFEPEMPYAVFLQSYRVHQADNCNIAAGSPKCGPGYQAAIFWASHRLETHGRRSIEALCELHRRGYWGVVNSMGAVERFQVVEGLKADDWAGDETMAALGIG